MKVMLTLLSLISAFALEVSNTQYEFKSLKVSKVKESKLVFSSTQAGKEEVKRLQAQGFLCVLQNSAFHNCSRFYESLPMPTTMREKLLKQLQGQKVTIGTLKNKEVVVDNSAFKVVNYDATSEVLSKRYDKLRHLTSRNVRSTIEKLIFTNEVDQKSAELILRGKDLYKTELKATELGPQHLRLFIIQARFQRI